MANEIQLTLALNVAKGNLRYNFTPPTAQINLLADPASGGVQNIGTAASEAVYVGSDISTAGWSTWMNLTTGTKVELGRYDGTTFHSFTSLNAGEPCALRLSHKVPYAIAVGGTAQLQYQVFSE